MLQRTQSTGMISHLLSDTRETLMFSEPCTSCTKHANNTSLLDIMVWLISCILYLRTCSFCEIFWHDVDICRSTTCCQGEGWIPLLCALLKSIALPTCSWQETVEGLLCHTAAERPNSKQRWKIPCCADAIPLQMLTRRELKSHNNEKRHNLVLAEKLYPLYIMLLFMSGLDPIHQFLLHTFKPCYFSQRPC